VAVRHGLAPLTDNTRDCAGFKDRRIEARTTPSRPCWIRAATSAISASRGRGGGSVSSPYRELAAMEYQSGAAREGGASFYSSWSWNNPTRSDCFYNSHTIHDADIAFAFPGRSERRVPLAAGDFDGDGFADLAIGLSDLWVNVFRGPLSPGVYSELDADALLTACDRYTCSGRVYVAWGGGL
jgi:hypothetical protein